VCVHSFPQIFWDALRNSFKFYLGIFVVSTLVRKRQRLLNTLLPSLMHIGKQTTQSSVTLALFVTLYQGTVCVHRNLTKYLNWKQERSGTYWMAGAVAALSFFVYVYIYIYIYVYMRVCVCACVCICTCVCVCTPMYVYAIYVCMYVYARMCMHV
jgi:hypothetical protein